MRMKRAENVVKRAENVMKRAVSAPVPIGTFLNSGTSTSQKCEAVPRRVGGCGGHHQGV